MGLAGTSGDQAGAGRTATAEPNSPKFLSASSPRQRDILGLNPVPQVRVVMLVSLSGGLPYSCSSKQNAAVSQQAGGRRSMETLLSRLLQLNVLCLTGQGSLWQSEEEKTNSIGQAVPLCGSSRAP